MDGGGASISGESAICGIIAGCSYGETTYENITVTNSKGADYQYYAGGQGVYGMPTHEGVTVVYNNPSKQPSND